MASVRAKNRWFHTVVVVGASLGGCGGQSIGDADDSDAGSGGTAGTEPGGGTSGAATGGASGASGGASGAIGGASPAGGTDAGVPRPEPYDCPSTAEFVCADYASLRGCYCNTGAPRAPSDCENPFGFRCELYPPGAAPTPTPTAVGCSCEPNAPTPETCPLPQIVCQSTLLGFANCVCDPSRPTSPDVCTRGVEWWRCQSQDPEFGCECACCVIR